MFGSLGWQEVLVILVLVLLLFGAKRLPEMGRSLGQAMREFKQSISGLGEEDNRSAKNSKPPDDAPG